MKTFRMIGMALVAVVLGFAMSSCDNDDDEVDPYKISELYFQNCYTHFTRREMDLTTTSM